MRSAGFTLIELLVVISIIGILSVMGYANYKDFAASQVAKKAAGEVQTYLRLAQSNATTSTLCNGQGAISWSLKFVDPKTIELHCNKQTDPTDYTKSTLTLENATIAFSCEIECSLNNPTFKYSVGSGALTITPPSIALDSSAFITIKITNTKNTTITQSFKITKGGAIDAK